MDQDKIYKMGQEVITMIKTTVQLPESESMLDLIGFVVVEILKKYDYAKDQIE